ncbi:MAG TPA: hypothetical protein VJR89_19635 [Polyangiales bacterium]|nr:hypothetical protein [Polyangiales bacterium]
MATIRWKYVAGTLLVVHAKTQPSESDWAAMMLDSYAVARPLERILVFADVSLSADQRRQLAELHRVVGTQAAAILTSSQLTRMIVTALSWMNSVHRAFDPRDVSLALDYLHVPAGQRRELLDTAREFARELNHTALERTLAAA